MSSKTNPKRGHDYTSHDADLIAYEKPRTESVRTFGDHRPRPRLSDPDYLILVARHRLISSWIARLPQQLDVLDVGGRVQPYRSLFSGRARSDVACDFQFTGLVDVIGSAEQLPFRDLSFDVVLCTQVLNYRSNPESFFHEAFRVLRSEGALIVSASSVAPPQHDERLRILEEGFRRYLRDFKDVTIEAEVHSAAGVCRTISQLIGEKLDHGWWRRTTISAVILLVNLVGVALEKNTHDGTRLTPNIAAFARRPGEQADGSA